jgi:predicted dehydrogenase
MVAPRAGRYEGTLGLGIAKPETLCGARCRPYDARMDTSRARVALIGAGAIAQSYVTAFEGSSSARLVAVVDVDPVAAQRTAERAAVPSFRTHGEMFASIACDAVIVCTPPVYHMEVAIDALRAGAHVLCEKPLTIGAFAARRMFAQASSAGRILTMASKFRFVADVLAAKELVERGAIGEVVRIENTFMGPVDMTQRWNSRVALSGGGVLIDNGTHSVDIMRFLLGPLVSACAVDVSADSRYNGCDDSVHLFVRSAAGIIGSIELSWTLATNDPSFLRIHGTAGTIDVGWRGSAYRLGGAAPVPFGAGYDKHEAFAAQVENFAGAIAGRNAPAIDRADAVASVEVIDAAYNSLWKNGWTAVEVHRLTPFERLVAPAAVLVS